MLKKILIVFITVVTTQELIAQSKSKEIEQLRKIARENEERAKKAEEQAEKYNQMAQQAQREAERQRYLAVARAIARKSLEIEDKSLAALLAVQAQNFSVKHGGYKYDNDIYNCLLAALGNFSDPFQKLEGHTQPIQALIAKPESTSILSLGQDGKVMQWTAQSNEWMGKELVPERAGYVIYGADISAARPWVIGGKKTENNKFSVYDLTYSLRKIDGLESELTQINFLPEAKGLYALGNSGRSIFLSDMKSAEEVIKTPEKISLMDFSRDASKLAGATSDGKLFFWDVKNNNSVSTYQIGSVDNRITAITLSPNSRDIMVGNEKGEVKIVFADNGVVRKILAGRYSQIEKIVFSTSRRFMAVLDKANVIRVFNMSDLNKWPQTIKETSSVGSLVFSQDDTQIFCSTKEKNPSIHIWSLRSENMAKQLCTFLSRNMTQDEWDSYVGDVDYEATCPDLSKNNK